jgi:hypothetical protein
MARGGHRQGAGRKKGFAAIEAEKSREFIAQKVGASLEPIIDVLIRQAKKGDIRSTQILFDRAYGRAAQAPDISEDSNPKPMQIVIHYPDSKEEERGLHISRESAERYGIVPTPKQA